MDKLEHARLHEASHLLALNATLGPGIATSIRIGSDAGLDGVLRFSPSGHPYLFAIALLAGCACDERLGLPADRRDDPRSDRYAALTLLGHDAQALTQALDIARQMVDALWPAITAVADIIAASNDALDAQALRRIEDTLCEPAILAMNSDD
jgi:hypothetical protein